MKENNIKDWLNKGTKEVVMLKKIIFVVVTLNIIYRLGYAIGAFLANIGL